MNGPQSSSTDLNQEIHTLALSLLQPPAEYKPIHTAVRPKYTVGGGAIAPSHGSFDVLLADLNLQRLKSPMRQLTD